MEKRAKRPRIVKKHKLEYTTRGEKNVNNFIWTNVQDNVILPSINNTNKNEQNNEQTSVSN
jgi:outer membrane protein assembly factor BamE (lipoprotein component of BamABCDE complex)